MPISTQLTQLARNVGALTADTNAIFEALRAKGVDVPANAQLSDVADMIESIVPSHQNEVEIGGRRYPYVQIGNQLWTTENLDWKMDGIGIGGDSQTTDAHAWYYNNAESTYGIEGNKYGLLYTYAAANLINSRLPNGWKIPSNSDYEVLLSVVNNDSLALKSTEGWEGQNGNNSSGFTAVPSGYKGDAFSGLYRYSIIHSMDLIDSTHSYALYNIFNDSIAAVRSPISMNVGISIRLVKDAPGYVTIGGRQYKTVTIGNQEWLADNLDYKFNYNGSTLPIGSSGSPTTPAAWYYDNNETNYGIDGTYRCGLLYNWYAAKYLDDNKATLLPSGWHVSTDTEWGTLITELGANPAIKLKALNNSVLSNWPAQWNGTDDYGFNALPSGLYDSVFEYIDVCARYWTTNEYSYYNGSCKDISTSPNVGSVYPDKTYAMSIRLVKDVT